RIEVQVLGPVPGVDEPRAVRLHRVEDEREAVDEEMAAEDLMDVGGCDPGAGLCPGAREAAAVLALPTTLSERSVHSRRAYRREPRPPGPIRFRQHRTGGCMSFDLQSLIDARRGENFKLHQEFLNPQ